MSTFDGKKLIASLGDIILGDYGPDASITIERDEDDFEYTQGASGFVEASNKNSNIHTITFNCMQTSPINDQLSALLESDRKDSNGEKPFLLKDAGPGGSTVVSFKAARIVKPASAEYGASTKVRVWTLKAGAPSDYNVGGNAASED